MTLVLVLLVDELLVLVEATLSVDELDIEVFELPTPLLYVELKEFDPAPPVEEMEDESVDVTPPAPEMLVEEESTDETPPIPEEVVDEVEELMPPKSEVVVEDESEMSFFFWVCVVFLFKAREVAIFGCSVRIFLIKCGFAADLLTILSKLALLTIIASLNTIC